MECPHCHVDIAVTPHVFALGEDQDGSWQVSNTRCPNCDRVIVDVGTKGGCAFPVWPPSSRPRLSEDVPVELESEYRAACQILPYSPEASAAISRRLLHRFLATHAGAGGGGLAEQVRRAADSEEIPPYLRAALQTLSRVTRLGAEGHKSLHPEALTPAEPGEAEWLLDVLQSLFELYFVQPARLRRKLDALEEKIGPTGEPAAVAAVEAPAESGAAPEPAALPDPAPATAPDAAVES